MSRFPTLGDFKFFAFPDSIFSALLFGENRFQIGPLVLELWHFKWQDCERGVFEKTGFEIYEIYE